MSSSSVSLEFRVDEGMFGIIALTDLSSGKSSRVWKVGTRFKLGSRARVTIIYTMYEGHVSNRSINSQFSTPALGRRRRSSEEASIKCAG